MTRTILIVIGAAMLLLLTVIGTIIGFTAYQGSGLDASSKAYVDETIPTIVSKWSKDDLLKRSSPQLLEVMNKNPEQINQLFNKLSKLGALKHYGGSKGQAMLFYNPANGKEITAQYVADATFENGEAHIQIRLVQLSGHWQYLLFNINSPIFLQ